MNSIGANPAGPGSGRRKGRRRCARATGSGRFGDRRTLNRNCTALDTFWTFWPPAPDARMNTSATSESSRAMVLVTGIIKGGRYRGEQGLTAMLFTLRSGWRR